MLFIGAGEMIELCATHFAAQHPRAHDVGQPHARARASSSRTASTARRIALNDLPEQLARVRHRRLLHRQSRCRSSARAWSSARSRRAATGRCSWSIWPCRATSRPKSRSWTTCSSTPWTTSARWCRKGVDARQSAVAQAEAIIETRCAISCTGWRTREAGADDPRAARPGRAKRARHEVERALRLLREATTRSRCWRRWRTALTNKLLHAPDAGAQRRSRGARPRPARVALLERRATRSADRGMKSSIAAKLAQLSRPPGGVECACSSSEDVTADMDSYRKLTREHAEIAPVVELYSAYRSARSGHRTGAGNGLPTRRCVSFAEAEIREARERMAAIEAELQKLLLPRDPNDERNIFLEIRAGTGGDESALFAGDLFRMYTRYAERKRWQVEVISREPVRSRRLQGGDRQDRRARAPIRKLKFESGGHRVQRVPATETQGRIHTSACTVAVMPEADEIGDVVHQSGRDAHRHLPRLGRRRAARQQDRLRRARHAPAHRHRGRVPGRPLAAQEQGAGAARAGRAHQGQADCASSRRKEAADAQDPDRQRRPLRAHPHLQLPAGPRHRPPHQPDAVQDRPASWTAISPN